MKKLLFLLLYSCSSLLYSQQSADIFWHKQSVDSLIKWVKNGNAEKISTKVRYPLNRKYPLPDIINDKEFIEYYNIIFDEKLSSIITSFDKSLNWINMKAKGIKLNNGIIWLDHNFNITKINYHSDAEIKERARLLDLDSKSVHPSIRNFTKPIMIFKTHQSLIRIDKVKPNQYRYCQWNLNESTSDKPKFVINNGAILTGENDPCTHYQFYSDGFTYKVYCGYVSIEKNGREIKMERMTYLKK